MGLLGLLLATTGVATAQDAKDPRDAEDVKMERKVRGLALRIGHAFACTDEKARDEFKEEAHHLFDLERFQHAAAWDFYRHLAIEIRVAGTPNRCERALPKLVD